MPYRFPAELADEFARDWNAAMRPNVLDTLEQCHPDFRDELADMLHEFLQSAKTPPYSAAQRARLAEKVRHIIDKHQEENG